MRTVLIVDDLASVRLYHSRFLAAKGFRCAEAADGAAALAFLAHTPVDLVVLDMVMPDMDGAAFLRELRKDSRFVRLPVLTVTSEALKDDTRWVADQYGAAVALKPLLPNELLRHIDALLAGLHL